MVVEKKNKNYNKSAIFLLPLIGINLNLFVDFYNVYYKSVYNYDENEKRIYVVYKINSITEDTSKNIIKSLYYFSNYNIDGFKVFIYRVPNIFIKDFNLFINGKYNSFSKAYKTLLLSSYPMKREELNKILNSLPKHIEELAKKFDVNSKDIKEIFPIPDEIEETFSISNNYKLEL